jgi:hypothetical protein
MRTNGVHRFRTPIVVLFEQTTGARNDLMPELFQPPDLGCVNRAQGVLNALIQCLVILR